MEQSVVAVVRCGGGRGGGGVRTLSQLLNPIRVGVN